MPARTQQTKTKQKAKSGASSSSRSRKQSKPKTLTRNQWMGIIAAAIIVATLGWILWWTVGGGSTFRAQNSLASYLKDKYNEEFIVKDLQYKNAGLGEEGVWKAQAYPKNNPDMVFEVDFSSHGQEDEYVGAIWTKEETPQFNQFVADSFMHGGINASVRIILSSDLLKNATRTSPPLNSAKTTENGFYYEAVLVRNQGNESTIQEDATHASALMSLIKNTGVKKYGLAYTIHFDSGETKSCSISSSDSDLSPQAISDCISTGRIQQ